MGVVDSQVSRGSESELDEEISLAAATGDTVADGVKLRRVVVERAIVVGRVVGRLVWMVGLATVVTTDTEGVVNITAATLWPLLPLLLLLDLGVVDVLEVVGTADATVVCLVTI